ncbi:hypothetical protein [Pseudomonas viridiflava]|uniref:hypothetical protein n=1 Tax=Pseudomonas viridiflava TaxID=33069 RepID=UPI000F02529E|nr:hypothetical protein [Pseudomonas viridiflava]
MSNQFKPGDLAILKSSEAEHLVGSVVELIEYLGSDVHVFYGCAFAHNQACRRLWWVKIVSGATFESPARGLVDEGFCAENRLIPLRGDFASSQQKAKESEPA